MERELIEADLAEFIEGETWPEPDENGEPTPLPDPTSVSGVLRRMKRLDREAAQINEVAGNEIMRIQRWRDDRLAGIERDVSWANKALENFTRLFCEATKKKSLALSDGTLKLIPPRDRVVVVDEDEFMAWALTGDPADPDTTVAHPEVVRIKYAVDMVAIKKIEQPTQPERAGTDPANPTFVRPVVLPGGEVVPGVVIERNALAGFNVTLGED